MAFADPQSIVVGSDTLTLPRTGSGNGTGSFATNDGVFTINVSNAYNKRIRRTARIDYQSTTTDALDPSRNVPVSASYYLVVDVPKLGIAVIDQGKAVTALVEWISASSGANLTKLLGGEN